MRFNDISQSVILSVAEDVLEYDEINWDRIFFYFDYDSYLELYYEEEKEVVTEEDLANMTEEELEEYYKSLEGDGEEGEGECPDTQESSDLDNEEEKA